MYRGPGTGRDDGRNRGQIGRSPPRRRRSPEGDNKFCIYCKIQVSSARLYEEHRSSAVHKQKEILIGKALSDGLQYCYTCEKIFPSKLALDAHCLMTRHKPLYRVEELQDNINQSANPIIPSHMEHPPSNPESRRAREEKERQDIVLKLKEVRGNPDSEKITVKSNHISDKVIEKDNHVETKGHFCEVCNVDCMNYSNYMIHIESWRHRSEVDKRRDEQIKVDKQKFEEEAEQQFDAAEEVERKKVPEHLTGKAGYFCEVCSIASTSESAYLDHLRNRKHFRQVGQMRRPYKCYFCDVEFNVGKDFNYHLESRPHMDNAFNNDNDKSKKKEKDDEWVEKKTDRRENRNKNGSRDTRKDDRSRRTWHSEKKEHHESRSKDGKKDIRKAEIKETVSKNTDGRKVEIVDSPADCGIKDLREKLKAQKIIITKSNSPETILEENKNTNEAIQATEEDQGHLREFEKEFEERFKTLMKEYDNDNSGLQEQLAKDRENDIGAYEKYEEEFKELSEEEEFIRGNIDNLEDDDPCKEAYIIDIIRVQRKMEEVRQQLQIKEMTIIKREILYRKQFPENVENQDGVNAESKASPYVYEYNHGNDEKGEDVQKVVEDVVSPAITNNVSEINSTDLRIKLERERLMKRLGPELESVDPSLREKLLSVIFEKEKDGDSLKPSKESKTGDTRQVVKDEDSRVRQTQMEILTKREKQLEIELADLKSNASEPKKNVTKSLVPQYDDVDDKKKDTKKRSRKRTASPSSGSSRSSSSSSSGDSTYDKRDKRKRRSSPFRSRGKPKRAVSSEKNRRKRRRSISRDREKRKRISVKRGRDDEKKKRFDRSKNEKKKTVKATMKSQDKGNKVTRSNKSVVDDNDSDVQEIPIDQVQSISVIGSNSAQLNMPTQVMPNAMPFQPSSTSNVQPIHRKEQFSFWKNPVVSQPATQDSPKEDIWDSAFSGGQKEDTTGLATLKLFDPSGGVQLPEDILNILKSVAPIIQQNQQHSKIANSSSNYSMNTHTSNSYDSSNSNPKKKLQTPVAITIDDKEQIQDEKDGSTRIRSILKKGSDQALSPQNVHGDPEIIDHPLPVIPGLDSSSTLDSSASRRTDNVGRSILKSQSAFQDHHTTEGSKSFYNENSMYSVTDGNAGLCDPPEKDDFAKKLNAKDDKEHKVSHGGNTYEHDNHYDKGNIDGDTVLRNKEWGKRNHTRSNITNTSNENVQLSEEREPKRHTYDSAPMDYRRQAPTGTDQPDTYNDTDKYRQPNIPNERDRADHFISQRLEGNSPKDGQTGRSPAENLGKPGNDRDPYLRSEVTHRVIDYSYVRDTRIIPDESAVESTRYNDNPPRQPVRYPGETDDEYYARFERFYEENRRNEEQSGIRREREGGIPPRR